MLAASSRPHDAAKSLCLAKSLTLCYRWRLCFHLSSNCSIVEQLQLINDMVEQWPSNGECRANVEQNDWMRAILWFCRANCVCKIFLKIPWQRGLDRICGTLMLPVVIVNLHIWKFQLAAVSLCSVNSYSLIAELTNLFTSGRAWCLCWPFEADALRYRGSFIS